MSNKILLSFSAFVFSFAPLFASGDFLIATNSMPKVAIVVAEDAPVAVKYAAGELAKYLNKMTKSSFR